MSGQVNELGLDPSICGSVTHSPDQFQQSALARNDIVVCIRNVLKLSFKRRKFGVNWKQFPKDKKLKILVETELKQLNVI